MNINRGQNAISTNISFTQLISYLYFMHGFFQQKKIICMNESYFCNKIKYLVAVEYFIGISFH